MSPEPPFRDRPPVDYLSWGGHLGLGLTTCSAFVVFRHASGFVALARHTQQIATRISGSYSFLMRPGKNKVAIYVDLGMVYVRH